METIQKTMTINVPVELLYKYLLEPEHLTELCPDLLEITDPFRISPLVTQFSWAYKMVGVRFEGTGQIKQAIKNEALDMRFWGGISASAIWSLRAFGGGSELSLVVDYRVPLPLLRKHTDADVCHETEGVVDMALALLTTHMQTMPSA